MRAAMAWLKVDPEPNPKKPGSGEGLAKCFAYVQKLKGQPARQVGKNWSVLAEIPEVETLTAVAKRGGANIMSELRNGWTGERLGHDYAADEKVIVLRDHRYRLCMTIGVQPLKAGPLLDDTDAGTPQRFVWFPVNDPGCPAERPEEPPRHQLLAWPPEPKLEIDNESVDVFDPNMVRASLLHIPADESEFQVLPIPDAARQAVDALQLAKLRGDPDVDPLDGHKLLCQLKVAAGLMCLNKRTDKIADADWDLAGVVMKVSDGTRAGIRKMLTAKGVDANVQRALSEGQRAVVVEDMKRDKAIKRVANGCMKWLQKQDDGEAVNVLMKRFSGEDKQHVWPALEWLEKQRKVIELKPAEYKGQDGFTVHLRSRKIEGAESRGEGETGRTLSDGESGKSV